MKAKEKSEGKNGKVKWKIKCNDLPPPTSAGSREKGWL